MVSIRLLLSNSYDPWFNLSLEEYIFKNMDHNQSILFLWRNQNTVVIGRAQNAWKECNTRRMIRDGIKLARRHSGGGAVFHDLGNTCFTFMSTHQEYNKNISFNIILDGLKNLGIQAYISGRNDLVVDFNHKQFKISGSAYRQLSNRQLHHGTLLLNVDLNKLVYYLNPDEKKIQSKGITSIRSRVINLNELITNSIITHEQVCQKLIKSFCQYYNVTANLECFYKHDCDKWVGFTDQFKKQCSWDWNFGSTPSFTHYINNRFTWGNVELYFNIENGLITHSHVFTDSLNPFPIEELPKKLIGKSYNIESIQSCCEEWMMNWTFTQELKEITEWLVTNIL